MWTTHPEVNAIQRGPRDIKETTRDVLKVMVLISDSQSDREKPSELRRKKLNKNHFGKTLTVDKRWCRDLLCY